MTFAGAQEALNAALKEMVGQYVWRSELGHGSFVTIDAGDRRINSAGVEQGEFSLWVYGAPWTVETAVRTVSSEDLRADMAKAVVALQDKRVEFCAVDFRTQALTLTVVGGVTLATTPSPDVEMDDWMLFLRNGMVISAVAGNLIYESASALPE